MKCFNNEMTYRTIFQSGLEHFSNILSYSFLLFKETMLLKILKIEFSAPGTIIDGPPSSNTEYNLL